MRGLLLVGPERAELTLLGEHPLHFLRPHRPRQLVLEVAGTGVETDAFELSAVVAAQRAQEVFFFPGVVDARESERAVPLEEVRQVPVAAHRHDGDALGLEVAAKPKRERLDGQAIARTLDKHYSAQLHIRTGD